MPFKFELNDNVLMKYANNRGVAVSEWWAESDIEKVVK